MHLVLLFCICCIPSAQSTFGPFMIGFFRARDVLKAADIMCSQFRSCRCQQGILSRHPAFIFWVSCPKHFSVKSLHSRGAAYDGKHEVRRRGSERAILPDYICTSQLILADMRHSRRAGGQMVKWRGGEGETMYECKMFSHFILGLCACDIISERRSSDNVSLRSNNLPTHNQKTNAKYDHRQYERGTRQHPSDAFKLQGWIILNGICNITFNFPSLWCLLVNFKLFYFCAIMIHRRDRAWFT